MASSGVAAQLSKIESETMQQRAEGYPQLLSSIISSTDNTSANLVAYVRSITSESIGVIQSRPLLSDLATQFRDIADNDIKIEAGQQILQLLAPKTASYEAQDSELKLIIADAYETDDDFVNSAKTLQTVQVDSTQRAISDDEKAKVWMRICRCYLEVDDPPNALTYLNKIKQVVHEVKDQATRLQFQLSQARISDAQRNFLDASASYLTLSNETVIDEEERLQALSAAITCAVLAPAGPLRARQLGKIYRDERASETLEYGILEKIYLNRLLAPTEVAAFASGLREHQLAKTSDGSTVLDKAVLEHNLLATSRIYANISFDNLGNLLGVSADKAERYASGMIESNRLVGSMDQISGTIHFNTHEGGHDNFMLDLRAWDTNIQNLAEEVEKITTMLQREEPSWYEQRAVV